MNPILSGLLFFVIVFGVAGVVYLIVHHTLNFPNLGRVTAFIGLGVPTLLDQLNVLPWGTILSDAEAKLVGFAIALFMAMMHVIDTVKAPDVPAPVVIPPVPSPPAV